MVKAGEAKKVAHPTDKAGKDEVTYSVSDLVYLKSETSPSAIQTKSETKSDTSLGGGESDKSDEAPK
jgi:hypothetical protein